MFNIDANGILNVSAEVVSTGDRRSITIDKGGNLSKDGMENMLSHMELWETILMASIHGNINYFRFYFSFVLSSISIYMPLIGITLILLPFSFLLFAQNTPLSLYYLYFIIFYQITSWCQLIKFHYELVLNWAFNRFLADWGR